MPITISAIDIYPIKSCRRVSVHTAAIAATGLEGDRLFQVVSEDGSCVTQRQHRVLATVSPLITPTGLSVSAPDHGAIEIPQPRQLDTTASALLGDQVRVADSGDEAAAWFSAIVQAPVRLVAMTEESNRQIGLPQAVSFAAAGPILVANEASLAFLVERASEPFGMDRFRPNLVVTGADAWLEDTWQSIAIGDSALAHMMAWPRCAVPQIDQVTAGRRREPARVLRSHRWCHSVPDAPGHVRRAVEGNALFGVTFTSLDEGAVISVGDEVEVMETGSPLIAAPPG